LQLGWAKATGIRQYGPSLMFAVLTVNPAMDTGQWLLVTLTAGVRGSLLSIGSAAGVAVMGQAPDVYPFMAHLEWGWAIPLGYAVTRLRGERPRPPPDQCAVFCDRRLSAPAVLCFWASSVILVGPVD